VLALDDGKVNAAAPPRLDGPGDPILVAERDGTYPATVGGAVTDTVSAVVSAPVGTTLNHISAFSPVDARQDRAGAVKNTRVYAPNRQPRK
jgi:hypothetical protein